MFETVNSVDGAPSYMGSACTRERQVLLEWVVGKAVAQLLKEFSMNLMHTDQIALSMEEEKEPGLTRCKFSGLINRSDIVSPMLPNMKRHIILSMKR